MFPLRNCSAAVCVVLRVATTLFPAFSGTDVKAAPHFCSQSGLTELERMLLTPLEQNEKLHQVQVNDVS